MLSDAVHAWSMSGFRYYCAHSGVFAIYMQGHMKTCLEIITAQMMLGCFVLVCCVVVCAHTKFWRKCELLFVCLFAGFVCFCFVLLLLLFFFYPT